MASQQHGRRSPASPLIPIRHPSRDPGKTGLGASNSQASSRVLQNPPQHSMYHARHRSESFVPVRQSSLAEQLDRLHLRAPLPLRGTRDSFDSRSTNSSSSSDSSNYSSSSLVSLPPIPGIPRDGDPPSNTNAGNPPSKMRAEGRRSRLWKSLRVSAASMSAITHEHHFTRNTGRRVVGILPGFMQRQLGSLKSLQLRQECPICNEQRRLALYPERRITQACEHEPEICLSCIKQSISAQMTSVTWDQLACPLCPALLSHGDMKAWAENNDFDR